MFGKRYPNAGTSSFVEYPSSALTSPSCFCYPVFARRAWWVPVGKSPPPLLRRRRRAYTGQL
nr:MAG TPA: hypothetical protein [Caudoviricetes sp.]